MQDINKVMLTGNLTRDPEIRATPSGTQVLGFGIASNYSRRDSSGQWHDEPNFIDCTLFGSRAEALNKLLRKGMKVAIDGELRYSSWEKNGQKRSKLEVIVDHVVIMSQRREEPEQQREPAPAWDYDMPF